MSYINTGRWTVLTLKQMAVASNGSQTPTGNTKPNVPSDPDYISPINSPASEAACPVPSTTTTTSTSTTTTTTTPTTTTTTTTIANGIFRLSTNFGTNITSLSGTGIPTFSLPTVGNANFNKPFYSTIVAQTLSVGISTPPVTIKIDVYVDGTLVTSHTGITTSGIYTVVIPSNVPVGHLITIAIDT